MKKKMQSFTQLIFDYRIPILSGFLIGTSNIPFPAWTLFVSLVPLFVFCLNHPEPRKVFWAGWWTQFLGTLIGFHWIAYTAHAFGHLPWAVSILLLLLFSAFIHLHIPLALLIWSLLHRLKPFSKGMSLALFVALLSLSERYTQAIFPWNFGYPWLFNRLGGFHWADVIGFEGLSSVTFLCNALLALAWLERKNRRRALAWAGSFAALLLTLEISGPWHGAKWEKTEAEIHIAPIQPNIGNFEKEYALHGRRYQDTILTKHIELSEKALAQFPETQLVVWPETAYPGALEEGADRADLKLRLKQYIARSGRALLTGSYSMDLTPRREYNAIFLFGPDGTPATNPYRKSILLAFGEYFPFGEYLPWLYTYVPTVSNFGRGSGPTVLTWEKVRLGPQICYEGLSPAFSVSQALQGAEILINVTNDSWFGTTFEPYQHLYVTFGRGLENRRPVVRVTNTGISAAMLASGKTLSFSPLAREWTDHWKIAYKPAPEITFFARYQHWFPVFWLVFVGGVLLLNVNGRTRHDRLERNPTKT